MILFLSTGAFSYQAKTKSVCIVIDLSASYTGWLEKAERSMKKKILPFIQSCDEITVLAISDSSFDEKKSIIFEAKMPKKRNWADKRALAICGIIRQECIKALELRLKERYSRTDIWRSLFYAGLVLENTKPENEKYLILFSDLDNNVKSENRDILCLKNVNVYALNVTHGDSDRDYLAKCLKWKEIFKNAGCKEAKILEPVISERVEIFPMQ